MSTPDVSVIMTVYNREVEVLLATLRGLWRAATAGKRERAEGVELVIADDGSAKNYPWELIENYCQSRFDLKLLHVPTYHAYRIGAPAGSPATDGHNGPSRAFNEALAASKAEHVIVMSSDVIATAAAWSAAMRHDPAYGPWTPRVHDLDGNPFHEFCGPHRIFPMPWFLSTRREALLAVGGWDETYLQGLSYDDNDISGKLALSAGWFAMDYEALVYHQSHEQLPYRLDIPGVKTALDRNRDWTLQKWGGVPFEGNTSPFDVLRKPVPSGEVAFKCVAPDDRLQQVIRLTTGMHAVKSAPVKS